MGKNKRAPSWLTRIWKDRTICLLLAAALALTLIPLLWIARYDMPQADDFSYGAMAHQAWQETGSVLAVLAAGARRVVYSWHTWQGTFSAIYLMSVQPGVFGTPAYALTPFLMLGALCFGTLFFCWALFRRTFGASRSRFLIIGLTWLLVEIQALPSAAEAFFWFNGAVYYTFFFGLSLVLYGLMLLDLRQERRSRRALDQVLMCLLAAAIGGANFSTALLALEILALAMLVLAAERDRRWLRYLSPFVLLLAALAVSVLAPGNAYRQAQYQSPGAVKSVLLALETGLIRADRHLNLVILVPIGFLAPFLWSIARKSRFRFRYPLLMAVVSFGLFSSQFCPPIYGMNMIGPDRLQDIIYDSFLFLLIWNLFYLLGWLSRRFPKLPDWRGYGARTLAVLGLVFLIFCAAIPLEQPFTSVSALRSLRSGEARRYAGEFAAREAQLEDSAATEVWLPAYADKPYVLFFDDIRADDQYFINRALAGYYGKDTVHLK